MPALILPSSARSARARSARARSAHAHSARRILDLEKKLKTVPSFCPRSFCPEIGLRKKSPHSARAHSAHNQRIAGLSFFYAKSLLFYKKNLSPVSHWLWAE